MSKHFFRIRGGIDPRKEGLFFRKRGFKSFRRLALILSLAVIFTGCGNQLPLSSPASEGTETTQEPSTLGETGELVDRTFPASPEYVKLTGRTAENNGIRWMIHSASKAEFTFRGTKASLVVRSDASINGSISSHARFAVYVNGERKIDHIVRKMEETLEVFSSDREEDVEISIIKLSEAANSVFGIKSIHVTSVGAIEPLTEKKMKIEFIGDSITCGYGVDDEVKEHHFSTATEDATKTYAYKAAEALDADYSIVAYSGHGIISGYSRDGNRNSTQLVPDVYELLGKNYGSADAVVDLTKKWDFSEFVPDHIVINLGTNDEFYTGSDESRRAEYIRAYVEFLKMIRKDNQRAHITASLGIMGDGLYPCVEEAVRQYSEETGDTNISTLHFKPQDGSTGYAADWHPTEKTQENASKELIEHLRSMGP